MKDPLKIRLKNTEITALCGQSLASCLYDVPVDIVLSGPVGAGKTTFVQGLAKGLGITEPVLSPTYALEQRYETKKGIPFLHLDLYRIQKHRVSETLAHSDAHDGIRCIEWADRMDESDNAGHGRIGIALEEEGDGRICNIMFDDLRFPSREDIEAWRAEVQLPEHIAAHCDVVATIAGRCAAALIERGVIVRPIFLQRAAEIHDLFRFVDFREGASPADIVNDPMSVEVWETWKKRFAGLRHEAACALFLRQKGFDALASVVEVHGLYIPSPVRDTIEQKILFYADKRVMLDRIVSMDERFEDFKHRYAGGVLTDEAKLWKSEADAIEKELFPDGAPS